MKVNTLKSLPIEPNRYLSQSDLEKLGLWGIITQRLNSEGWKNLTQIRDPCYLEIFIEFLASFSMDKKRIDYKKPGVINFRLGGKQFSLSIMSLG